MPHAKLHLPFFMPFFMGAVLILSLFTIFSCNGNGGSSDADGEIYIGGVQI
ncbi:MAG: hypothetical protein K6G18_12635 [Treponema sp.]|nr:hypothetical protein [Treponema sp.]